MRRFVMLALAPLVLASAVVPRVPADVRVDAGILSALGPVTVIVHVADDARLGDAVAIAEQAGVAVGNRFEAFDAFLARGNSAQLATLARSGVVEWLEADRALTFGTNSSHVATRGQAVLDGAVTAGGQRIDGKGIGVAIVDTGIDGTHPDFAGRIGRNVRMIPFTGVPVAVADSDTPGLGGHGTHVAGIVAGDGAASDGRYHGAAPGATLYGVGVGVTLSMADGISGLEWVLDNHNQVTPRIRVVNNSWTVGAGTYNPDALVQQLNAALVAAGVVVVWAAGNGGGSGTTSAVNAACTSPVPGVICVANYDDNDIGDRDGRLNSGSSRGQRGEPETYPDISAPGTSIISTCRLTLPICALGPVATPPNSYANLTGTSMAAPHVAGIVALMLQAKPKLTPAKVEDMLEDTAYPFDTGYEGDATNPTTPTSFDKGHGLVDALRAVRVAKKRR